MRIRTKLGFGLAAVALLGGFGFPDAAFAQSTIRFVDSGQRLGTNDSSLDVALGDVNGDGDPDAVVAIYGGFRRVWTNQGGVFADSGQNLATGLSLAVALADLDADGDRDVFFLDEALPDSLAGHKGPPSGLPSGTIPIWINQGGAQGGTEGVFQPNGQMVGNSTASAVALGELDAIPGPDAFVTYSSPVSGNKVWLNSGTGQFYDSGQDLGNDLDVALADLDGDNDLDAFVVNEHTNRIWLNQNGDGAGTFANSQTLDNGLAGAISVALGDLDGDGDVDALVAGITNRVWINQGGDQGGVQGTFTVSAQTFPRPDDEEGYHVVLGDLDRDGDLDAIVTTSGPIQSTSRVYENDGAARFTDTGVRLGTVSSTGAQTTAVALGDLDGDGDWDAFVARHNEPDQIWLNTAPPPIFTFSEYLITAIAGNGTEGSAGDGGPAIGAQLDKPVGVAIDAQDNLYIADADGHRVRKVTPEGIISTIAGTGVDGGSGDGGPATQAQLNEPIGVAVAPDGVVYIAERSGERIRQVDTNGVITTLAGLAVGSIRPNAVALDLAGNVYVAGPDRILRIAKDGSAQTIAGGVGTGFGGDGGPATQALFNGITALAIDIQTNIYVADTGNHRVRKIGSNGIITTVVGTGINTLGNGGLATAACLGFPHGVAIDAAGNLFISESGNRRVRRVATNGIIGTIAGNGRNEFGGDGGPARDASLETPFGLTMDSQSNVYVATGHRVRKLSPTTNMVPLVPRFFSRPPTDTTIDVGVAYINEDMEMSRIPATRTLQIGNTGTADLRILSIQAFVPDSEFSFALTNGAGDAVSLPYVVSDGFASTTGCSGSPLRVTLRFSGPYFVNNGYSGMLWITTNDPETPVASCDIYFCVQLLGGTGDESTSFRAAPDFTGEGWQLIQPAGLLAAGLQGTETATFLVDPDTPHTLTTEIPAFLGGGSIQLSNFTGRFTVSLHPIPNDPERAAIRIENGLFTAPSFVLPSGLETGPNTFTFGPGSESEGLIDLMTGEYSASDTATIVNDLIPQGFPVRGSYTGVYQAATGQISVQSQSTDYFPTSDQVQFNHSPGALWLTWSGGSALEEATDVLGPWRTVTDAVSPYRLVITHSQQFFRLRLPAP